VLHSLPPTPPNFFDFRGAVVASRLSALSGGSGITRDAFPIILRKAI
jgi:hypothetical protein